MAKKRKLVQTSTPTPVSEPEPESETQSQPETGPIEEDQQPPTEQSAVDVAAKGNGDDEMPEGEEKKQEEEKEDEEKEAGKAEEEQKPQTLDTAAAPNGSTSTVAADQDVEDDSDPQSVQKILELFPKDQLVDLLRDFAVKYPDIMKEIHRAADVDPAHRKVFVHGLGWETTAKMITDVFSQYGEIEDCNAPTDKATGKSKGYAFVLFKHRKGAQNALREPQKKIGHRNTACQLASMGPGPGPAFAPPPAPPVSELTQRKIFVSNVGADVDPQKLLDFFKKFGEVEEGPLGLDKATGKPRGFCLFVYKSVESARKALEEPHKNFEGHVLHCQKAIDGPKSSKGFQFQQNFGGQYSAGIGGPKGNFSGGVGGHLPSAGGHLMAPPATGVGYNQAVASSVPPAAGVGTFNPAINQALTALLLGGLGTSGVNQGVPGQMGNAGLQGGYGSGQMYGAPGQGGYGGRQQGYGPGGGGPSYMGHH